MRVHSNDFFTLPKHKGSVIFYLNTPNGSRDIPFQGQGSEQDGRRHFIDV